MGVIGEADVRAAAAVGRAELVVGPGDILTPQGRDVAAQFGLRILDTPPPPAVQPIRDHATAIRRVLLRRSPKWVTPSAVSSSGGVTLAKVSIVGSGAVGASTGHLLAMRNTCDRLALIDIVPGLAASTALDIEHASGITRSRTRCEGGETLDLVRDSDVVVITAGRPRSPGMNRAELATGNARVVRAAAEAVADHAPQAVIVVVTNPLDEMSYEAIRSSGFPRSRVLGMAGTLDSARFRWALAMAADVVPADVQAFTLGSHGDEMVPIISHATIKGRPVHEVLRPAAIERCVNETVHGGGRIVELRRTGSASIAPAHAIGEVIDAIRGANSDPIPVSLMLEGEYGITDTVVGVLGQLFRHGLKQVVEVPLADDELKALRKAAEVVTKRISEFRR